MSECLPVQSPMPRITPTLLVVSLRSVWRLVDPIARFQWGYRGSDGWSAVDKQRFSSAFFHFRKSSTQPIRITINPFRKHFPSSCRLPAALQTRCAHLLITCALINMLGQSFVILFPKLLLQTCHCLFFYFRSLIHFHYQKSTMAFSIHQDMDKEKNTLRPGNGRSAAQLPPTLAIIGNW